MSVKGKSKFFQHDVDRTRLEGLRNSLQLSGSIISRIPVSLSFKRTHELPSEHSKYPAFSIGSKITVNLDRTPDVATEHGMAVLLGEYYHELAHAMFTPRAISVFQPELIKRRVPGIPARFQEIFNMLEEPRVETLLSSLSERMKHYFIVSTNEFVVRGMMAGDESAFLLLHGRRYLPAKVRSAARALYEKEHGKDKAQKAADIIDEYRTLAFPADLGRGAECIHQMLLLVVGDQTPEPEHGNPSGDHKQNPKISEEAKEKAQQQDRQQQEEELKQEEEPDAEEDKQDSDPDNGEESEEKEEEGEGAGGGEDEDSSGADDEQPALEDGSGEDDGESDEDVSGGGEDHQDPDRGDDGEPAGAPDVGDVDGDDGESSGQEDGQDAPAGPERADSPGNGVGDGDSEKTRSELKEEILEVLLDAVEESLSDTAVQEDLAAVRDAMDDTRSNLSSGLAPDPDREKLVSVTQEMVASSDRYAQELRRIWLQMEPGWNRPVLDGRLDMNLVFGAAVDGDWDRELCTEWDEGQQHNSKVEIALLADVSGSMGAVVRDKNSNRLGYTRMQAASKNIWELRAAAKEVEADITVLTYESTCCELYKRGDPVDTMQYADIDDRGGTNPGPAIREARRILSLTDNPGKILVIVSDGAWPNDPEIGETLGTMDDVVKILIIIGSYVHFMEENKFDFVYRTTGDILEPVAQAAVLMMQRMANR